MYRQTQTGNNNGRTYFVNTVQTGNATVRTGKTYNLKLINTTHIHMVFPILSRRHRVS